MSRELTEGSKSKTVFLIGSQLTQEGITTKIKSLGHSYEVRNPFSTPFNWMKIEKDLNHANNSQELLAVFLHLTEGTIFRCCSPEYQEVLYDLLMEMKRTATLIFIYEDNLLGKFSSIEEEERLSKERKPSMRVESSVFLQFQKEGALKALETVKTNIAEVEIRMEQALRKGVKPESFHRKIEIERDLALLFLRWVQTEK